MQLGLASYLPSGAKEFPDLLQPTFSGSVPRINEFGPPRNKKTSCPYEHDNLAEA